jgi:hypothetical protein
MEQKLVDEIIKDISKDAWFKLNDWEQTFIYKRRRECFEEMSKEFKRYLKVPFMDDYSDTEKCLYYIREKHQFILEQIARGEFEGRPVPHEITFFQMELQYAENIWDRIAIERGYFY